VKWVAWILAAGLLCLLVVDRGLRSRLAESRSQLEEVRRERDAASAQLGRCEAQQAALGPDRSACECPEMACPDWPESPGASPAATGRELADASEARTQRTRELFDRKLEAAYGSEGALGRLDAPTRRAVVDRLMEIRSLRSRSVDPELDPVGAERSAVALHDAEQSVFELTGLGVGELLHELERRPGPREPPPEGFEEGAVRKRFADEISRQLGIAEPGTVEVLEGDDWKPQ